ncbi:MAG: plasmid pRiA4b ORF-3 family protein [Bacteriovoracaceae bacterium]
MAKKKRLPKVYELIISLIDTEPVVWRKVLVHEFIELNELHILIQMVMGWQNTHLYAFEIGGKFYSDEESAKELKDTFIADGTMLCDVLEKRKKFSYIYDFGDSWAHEIRITKILETDPRMQYPACIGGENACPPEDCGGPSRFEHLKSVLAGKDCEEKDMIITWVGGYYNPYTFDPNFVNRYMIWAEDEFED